MPNLDYFHGNESNHFRFYRIPKALLSGEWDLSLEAVTLYGLLLDRVGLSIKSGWTDEQGRVYIYFVQTEVQKRLHCGHNKATALMRELERFGLIERKRQGLGKPMKIYVKNFLAQENEAADNSQTEMAEESSIETACGKPVFSARKEAVQTAHNQRSRAPLFGGPDCPKQAANNTEKKETEWIEPHPSSPIPPRISGKLSGQRRVRMDEIRWVKKQIQENIGLEELVLTYPADKDLFNGYVDLMAEACCSTRESVRICGQDLPTAFVRSRFLKLERDHITYVRDCLCTTTATIGNIKAYTLAALYNAPATMDQYYAALVSRDMA